MARMQRSLFAQLNALAEEISQNAEKVAAVKEAAPVPADPGGYQGASAHPSAHVDNNVQKATTGARAAEYEADIKKQQGAPAVDNTPEMSQEGRQDEVQLNINTNASAVGEDPSIENDYKGKKDDPPTTLPSAPQDSEKYSSVTFKEAHARCSALGNKILADIITVEGNSKKAEAPVAAANDPAVKAAEMPEALKKHKENKENKENKGELKGDQHEIDVDGDGKIEGADLSALRNGKEAAFAAGYELAAALGVEKAAAEAAVRDVCANTLREADEMADLFIGFYTKKAEADPTEEATEGEDHESKESPAEESAEEAGSAPADSADVGGLMGGEEAGLEAAPPSEDEALQELAMALQELGISPEALLAGIGGGGEAGADPMAGAMGADPMAAAGGAVPPEMAPKMAAAQELKTIGNAVVNFQRSGNFQVKEARTKRSRELRDIMKAHVRELVSR